LPLLLTGPLAGRRLRTRPALLAAGVGGIVSGAIAAVSLAAGCLLLGAWFWSMNAAAGAPPMPPLPRILLFPTTWMSWAQQDILFFQPPLAVALYLLARVLGQGTSRLGGAVSRVLPGSIGGRLRLAFGALTVLALAPGIAGFGTIEEMHIRTHEVQLRADWQRQLGVARAAFDDEQAARLTLQGNPDPAASIARAATVTQVYDLLGSTATRPGISARPDDLTAALVTYRPALDLAIRAHQAFREAAASADDPDRTSRLFAQALIAHGNLERIVNADVAATLTTTDVAHHQRLILAMVLVAVAAGLGLWTGERILESIGVPLARLGAHVRRVARGDFGRRVPPGGPAELQGLGQSINQMTADLARLYDLERQGRAMAEALAVREQELSAAKEFWTNTLVHDLKNPLALIAGWTDLLEHETGEAIPPTRRQAIREIRQATRMLNGLVTDINDTFRLQAAELPIHQEAVAPDVLVRSAVADYSGVGRPAPELYIVYGQPSVLADARLVGRVFQNLLGNAYKHAGAGARVVLTAEPGAGTVRFLVDDDGAGIPEAERARVFDRFVQGPGAAQGSGLGLAFCKLVIEQLGGCIWADQSPLGGARIGFALPVAPAEAGSAEAVTLLPATRPLHREATRELLPGRDVA
ncbi:MAG: ATP-binding protein, partial [Chloroflexota bacterium]